MLKSKTELESEGMGDIMTKAILDVDDCAEGMRKFTTEVFDTGVALAAYAGMLLVYDVRLALIAMIFLPISYLLAEKMKIIVQRTGAEYRVDGERMADFINVGFGNMVNGDKIISMVSTDAAPIKRMIQNARDEGKAVDATCGRRTRAVLVMESGHLILSALTTDTLSSRCHSKRNDEDEENER